jgi:peroxiredoxin
MMNRNDSVPNDLTVKAANINMVRKCLVSLVVLAAITQLLYAEDIRSDQPASGFAVLNMRGQLQNYPSLKGEITVVIFFSTRCPMSNAFNYRRNVLYRGYRNRVRFIVIDSNSNESLDEVRAYANDVGFDFPVYRDLDNQVADLFGARNTTESFVLDSAGVVRYRGYIEDAPNPERTTKQGLRLAIEAVLAGQPVLTPETRGIGCAIRRAHLPNQRNESAGREPTQ